VELEVELEVDLEVDLEVEVQVDDPIQHLLISNPFVPTPPRIHTLITRRGQSNPGVLNSIEYYVILRYDRASIVGLR
jgi:hypothetical protein